MGKKSVLKEDIIRLRNDGKKFREIKEILGCSYSTISFNTSEKEYKRTLNALKITRQNGKAYKARSVTQERNRQFIDNYLQIHPCVDCNIFDRRVLEFDHVRGVKLGNVSKAIGECWSVKRLTEEIEKCDVRCCNCHRIKTRERLDYKKNNNTKTN
jgi:transposase